MSSQLTKMLLLSVLFGLLVGGWVYKLHASFWVVLITYSVSGSIVLLVLAVFVWIFGVDDKK